MAFRRPTDPCQQSAVHGHARLPRFFLLCKTFVLFSSYLRLHRLLSLYDLPAFSLPSDLQASFSPTRRGDGVALSPGKVLLDVPGPWADARWHGDQRTGMTVQKEEEQRGRACMEGRKRWMIGTSKAGTGSTMRHYGMCDAHLIR